MMDNKEKQETLLPIGEGIEADELHTAFETFLSQCHTLGLKDPEELKELLKEFVQTLRSLEFATDRELVACDLEMKAAQARLRGLEAFGKNRW